MNNNTDENNLRILTFYSTIAYLFANFIISFVFNTTTGIVASLFKIKSIFINNKLLFITPDNSSIWSFDSRFYIFCSGIILLLLLILFLMRYFDKIKNKEDIVKIFLFWIVLHSINRIVTTFMIGELFDLYSPHVTYDWFAEDVGIKIIMLGILAFILYRVGVMSIRYLLYSSFYFELIAKDFRYYFIISQALKPWLISSFVILIFNLPSFLMIENLYSLTMFMIILPAYFNYNSVVISYAKLKYSNIEHKFSWKIVSILAVFLLILRIILHFGIKF